MIFNDNIPKATVNPLRAQMPYSLSVQDTKLTSQPFHQVAMELFNPQWIYTKPSGFVSFVLNPIVFC